MTLVTLYAKPGCHLCEEARQVVVAARDERGFDLEEVDVTLDPVMHARYGERIPVLEIEGEEAFEFHIDPAGLRERLDRVAS